MTIIVIHSRGVSWARVVTGKCISRIFIPESEWGIPRLNSCRFTSFALPHEILSFAGKYFSILHLGKA